jgi:hypothetical protein
MVQVLLLAYFGVLFAAMLWSLVRRAVVFVRSRLSKH